MKNKTSEVKSLEEANALLLDKLQTEYGMLRSYMQGLSPELQNTWLNTINKFEEKKKAEKPLTLFVHLGRPQFPRFDQLSPIDVSRELERLKALMHDRHVVLDCAHEYADATIYRFITEELFAAEMYYEPNIRLKFYFNYEKYYPW